MVGPGSPFLICPHLTAYMCLHCVESAKDLKKEPRAVCCYPKNRCVTFFAKPCMVSGSLSFVSHRKRILGGLLTRNAPCVNHLAQR